MSTLRFAAFERPSRSLKFTLLLGAMGCALVFVTLTNNACAQPAGYSLRDLAKVNRSPTRTKTKMRVSVVLNGDRIQALGVQRRGVSVLLTDIDGPERDQPLRYRDRDFLADRGARQDELLHLYTRDGYGRTLSVTMVPTPVNYVTGQFITQEMIQESWYSDFGAYSNDEEWEY